MRSHRSIGVTGSTPAQREGMAGGVAVMLSVLAGLLTAVLSVPGAFWLWVGISVAVGRGDPTWNDGEEVWGTGLGVFLTALVGLLIHRGVRAVSIRVRAGIRQVVAVVWITPTLALHVVFAANFIGG